MAHHRDFGVQDGGDGRQASSPALELDPLGAAFLHQADRVVDGLDGRFLVGAEWQVRHEQSGPDRSPDDSRVVEHGRHVHRQSG